MLCYNFICHKDRGNYFAIIYRGGWQFFCQQKAMMGRVQIRNSSDINITNISNVFIDEYMGEANDAQIKVYLYLLRMMQGNLPTSVTDIADKFNHTEKDVTRSLRYWEKKGLISLEFDSSRHLTGIHMEDLPAKQANSASSIIVSQEEKPSVTPQNVASFAPVLNTYSAPQKPTYSVKELSALKKDSDCSQLLFIAEQYFGRTLNVTEMQTILYIHCELNFSDDLLDYLMQYCIEHNKTDFRYMEKVAIEWDKEGIKTSKAAKANSGKYDKKIYKVMKLLGMDNVPTEKEVSYINTWFNDYDFSMDIIHEACDRTVLSTQKNRLRYADGILKNWNADNVKTKADIAKLDQAFSPSSKKAPASKEPRGINSFPQNTYDFEELEKKLLNN